MKKLVLALSMLLATAAQAAQNIKAWGYCRPGSSTWISANNWTESNSFILPPTAYLDFKTTSQEFTALYAEDGWKVESWYWKNNYGGQDAGQEIANSAGKGKWTWGDDGTGYPVFLSVKYAYISYRVEYETEGSSAPSPKTVGYTNEFALAAAPTRTGYAFAGWKDSLGNDYNASQSVHGDSFTELKNVHDDSHMVTLTAQWNANDYAIAGAATNGSVTIDPSPSAKYTNDVTITWAPGADVGYDYSLTSVKVYAGTSAEGTPLVTYTSGTKATFNMSRLSGGQFHEVIFVEVVYARTQHQHSVRVGAGEHGTVRQTPEGASFPYGQTLELEAKPSAGYAFEKWSDESTSANRSLSVLQDVSLTATFTNRVYTLTLDANDGRFADESEQKTLFVKYEDYIEGLPGKNEVKQYLKTLKGWFTAESGGTQIDSTSRYVWTKDVTLYAQWEDAQALVVTVVANPSDGGTVTGGGNFEQGAVTTLTATPNDGYSFASWSDGGAQTHEVTINANAKYTATFTGNVYTVRFDWDDPDVSGTITPRTRSYVFGQPYGELPLAIPDSPDDQFAGWVDEDGNEVTAESVMNMSGKRNNLYAKVTPRPFYTIIFDGNGATTGEMGSQKAYCGEDVQLTPNAYARSACKFLNWTNEVGGIYEDGATVRDLAEKDGEARLYANWKELTLAEAMHCENLEWTDEFVAGQRQGVSPWTICSGENVGSNSWSCLSQAPSTLYPSALTSEALTSAGTLTFFWKPTGGTDGLFVWCDGDEQPMALPDPVTPLTGVADVWQPYTLSVEPNGSKVYVHIFNFDLGATICVDLMKWTPASPTPQQGEPVTVESASVAGGAFRLGVAGAEGVNYGVWTNADLTVPAENWGFMTNWFGEGAPFEFKLEIRPDEPQLFYRAFKVE